MALNDNKWKLAVSSLTGLMQHLPAAIDEDCVKRYHEILLLLEQSSNEDLSLFKISDAKLARKITSFSSDVFGDGPSSATYSEQRFCDGPYFRSQIHGLSNYIQMIMKTALTQKPSSRDSLSNHSPKPSISNVYNIRDSNFIHSSPSASITETGSDAKELVKILAALKELSSTPQLPPEDKAQMKADIGTIELQMESPRPNNSIIRASLESVATILEHAAGILLGETALMAIKGYLGVP